MLPTFFPRIKPGRLHLRLKPAAETQVRSGHPWVFSESIREQSRPAEAGELAIIFDRKDEFLALGLFDPESPIRVRIIHRGKPVAINDDWWRAGLTSAGAKRASLFTSETNAARLVNGESDQFPGLVLDRYAETLVLKIYSAVWLSRIPNLVNLIRDVFAPGRLVLRMSRNLQSHTTGWYDGQVLHGNSPDGPVLFLENGLRFEADVLKGQKTGFFLDQRENRAIVGGFSKGRNVLNAFSFSGGFSLYAAQGGARSVTDVDISAHALEGAARNFALNQALPKTGHCRIQADVFEWLRSAKSSAYDLIILDPPSLARRETEKAGALSAYAALAEAGIRLARRGGIVVCCSCSAHVRSEEFVALIRGTAAASHRKVEVIKTTGQPLDHPASFLEGEYLKAVYLRVKG